MSHYSNRKVTKMKGNPENCQVARQGELFKEKRERSRIGGQCTESSFRQLRSSWANPGHQRMCVSQEWACLSILAHSPVIRRQMVPRLPQATHLTSPKTANNPILYNSPDTIPRFGLPISLGSYNCLAFITKVSLNLTKVLNVDEKLHCTDRPQNLGMDI